MIRPKRRSDAPVGAGFASIRPTNLKRFERHPRSIRWSWQCPRAGKGLKVFAAILDRYQFRLAIVPPQTLTNLFTQIADHRFQDRCVADVLGECSFVADLFRLMVRDHASRVDTIGQVP